MGLVQGCASGRAADGEIAAFHESFVSKNRGITGDVAILFGRRYSTRRDDGVLCLEPETRN